MAYLGNQPTAGENNSFKILDDITTYTLTFDGSSSSVVSVNDDKVTRNEHRFITGQRVTYTHGGGTAIGGLTSGSVYYIIKDDQNSFKFASSYANAISGTAINITALGTGSSHTVNVAFDGVNTKFKATYDNGTKAQMTRAAQLQISINGVIQQPQDTTSPTNGFGIDLDSVIVFSVAPVSTDIFWGNLVANNFPTFDISDNSVDTFTGNGSQVSFTLSKTPANSQNILVTLDGVVQYPSDNTTTRAYTLSENVLTFDSAPGSGVSIQVRHIGFAGATSSNVTGFYGRTGNVALRSIDNITVGNVDSVGFATFTATGIGTVRIGIGSTALLVEGNARVTGILTVGTGSLVIDGLTNTIAVGTTTGIGQTVGFTTVGLRVGESFIQRNAIGLGQTTTIGRNAGVGTATGTLVYNSTTGLVEVYNGTFWQGTSDRFIQASGGIVTSYYSGGVLFAAHTFTSSGTFSVVSAPSNNNTIEYLVVAGGGGGGIDIGGGGGAGGFRTGIGLTVNASPGSYTISVGGGGGTNVSGSPSFISGPGITSITSAGGGNGVQSTNGGPGGSGGGARGGGTPTPVGGSGNTPSTSPPQGNPGASSVFPASAGGGGGAGAVGGTGGPTFSGNGGNGQSSSISGVSVTYAGGGGGGSYPPLSVTAGSGGSGGGGAGGIGTVGSPGTVNTGGGAGGGAVVSNGGSGGSGIVIVRYQIGQQSVKATGGTVSYSGGKTIHTFTSSATFTVTDPALSSVDYLVVGGGGGGGSCFSSDGGGGGGGAGALRYATGLPVSATPGSYQITVGAGGNGDNSPGATSHGAQGSSSIFGPITSPGGGGGGSTRTPSAYPSGGSTGGAGSDLAPNTAATATGSPGGTDGSTSPSSGWGNPGGNNSTGTAGAGGGGAGAAGSQANEQPHPAPAGPGGNGLAFTISGSSVTYAGGGGGGIYNGNPGPAGSGGSGGGGAGGKSADGVPGTFATGGGGGGGGMTPTGSIPRNGGNGGSGIVIIAYPS